MDNARWDSIRAAARTFGLQHAASRSEAEDAMRAADVAAAQCRSSLEQAVAALPLPGIGSYDADAARHTDTIRTAWLAAEKTANECASVVEAHRIADTPFEERDLWWGHCHVTGDPWAAVRRYM